MLTTTLSALAGLAAVVGIGAAVRGARLLAWGLRDADDEASSLRVIRGIRGLVVAVGLWALAGGVLLEQTWLLVFGAIFLAEEIYETGVVILVLRAQARRIRSAQRSSTGSTSSAFAAGRLKISRATPASP
jgi:hypothetical protein